MIRRLNVNNHKRPTQPAMMLLQDILSLFSCSGTRITARLCAASTDCALKVETQYFFHEVALKVVWERTIESMDHRGIDDFIYTAYHVQNCKV